MIFLAVDVSSLVVDDLIDPMLSPEGLFVTISLIPAFPLTLLSLFIDQSLFQ